MTEEAHPHILRNADAIREFIAGGNARFTLKSLVSGRHFTYRVRQAQDNENMFFVSVLAGPENTLDYQYIGFLKDGDSHSMSNGLIAGRKGRPDAPSFKGLDWLLRNLPRFDKLTKSVEVWHEGRCARCARVLTDPVSIERGFGPECVKHVDG